MTQAQANLLSKELRTHLKADVEAEKVGPGRFRFAVVSPRFARMRQLKRQDVVWQIADRALTREAILGISLILTFAPNELARH